MAAIVGIAVGDGVDGRGVFVEVERAGTGVAVGVFVGADNTGVVDVGVGVGGCGVAVGDVVGIATSVTVATDVGVAGNTVGVGVAVGALVAPPHAVSSKVVATRMGSFFTCILLLS